MDKLSFLSDLILRVPLLSIESYDITNLSAILKNNYLLTAIALSSPGFHDRLIRNLSETEKLNLKEQVTLFKYFNRLCFRPTPFGSFASVSTLAWGTSCPIDIGTPLNVTMKIYPDQRIAIKLAEQLFSNFLPKCFYHINRTLYKVSGGYRFIETTYSNDNYLFTLQAIENNFLTSSLIKYCGTGNVKGEHLLRHFEKIIGLSPEHAMQFFVFVVGSKILINNDEPYIIGEDYFTNMTHEKAKRIGVTEEMQSLIRALSLQSQTSPNHFFKLEKNNSEQLKQLGVEAANPAYYVIAERNLSGELDSKYQAQITQAIGCLRMLAIPGQPKGLMQFTTDFKARYEQQSIPLLELLDPHIGIGYDDSLKQTTNGPVTNKVKFPARASRSEMMCVTDTHRLLLQKLTTHAGKGIIDIDDNDLAALQQNMITNLPNSLAVIFRTTGEGLFIENAGGASGTALIGRFTLASDKIWQIARKLARHEMATNTNVIFAEIGQLSDSHADNVNRRRAVYDYEIPINANSTLPESHQILLTDLRVQIINNEIILLSKKLKKRIIPRLSSAYSYQRNDLTVFRFLCDLQHQRLTTNLQISLHQLLPGLAFYPRIVYKGVILYQAQWHFSLTKQTFINSKEAFYKWKKENRIPDNVLLTENDQQLHFNLANEMEISFFLECIKGRREFVLREHLANCTDAVVKGNGLPFNHQFVTFLTNSASIYPALPIVGQKIKQSVIRCFPPGSEWLYFKIFLQPEVTDDLLINALWPILKRWQKGAAFCWFFVRYTQEGNHLRLRLNVPPGNFAAMLGKISKVLSVYLHRKLIHDFQIAIYQRELERYSPELIILVEDFSCASSELIVQYLSNAAKSSRVKPYHMALLGVNELVGIFFKETEDQLLFCKGIADSFFNEFEGEKPLKIDLDKKYQEWKQEMVDLLNDQRFYTQQRLGHYAKHYRDRALILAAKTSGSTLTSKESLLSDLVHLHLNRIFADKQRQQEFIIYYCLYKYKKMILARKP